MRCRLPLLALGMAMAISGCAIAPIETADLEWEPAVLHEHGCPNLTGKYRDEGSLSLIFYAGLSGPSETVKEGPVSDVRVLKLPYASGQAAEDIYAAQRAFSQRAVLSIHQGTRVLEALLSDETEEVFKRITVRLGPPRVGCHNGALVMRWASIGRRAEWGGGNIEWGEHEIRKLPDGSLEARIRRRQRSLSTVTGLPSGDTKTWPETTNRYHPAR